MTDKNDTNLNAYFAAARKTAMLPSDNLMARILADADAAMPVLVPVSKMTPHNNSTGFFATLWAAIGGWPAAAGMATATLVGIWIGFSQPAGLDILSMKFLAADSALVDLVSVFDAELWEG